MVSSQFVYILAYTLLVSNHYLNQCYVLSDEKPWDISNKLQWKSNKILSYKNVFENSICHVEPCMFLHIWWQFLWCIVWRKHKIILVFLLSFHNNEITQEGRQWPLYPTLLTHLSLDKMATISQTALSNAFGWIKSSIFWFKFHWSLFLRVQLTIIQYWLGTK